MARHYAFEDEACPCVLSGIEDRALFPPLSIPPDTRHYQLVSSKSISSNISRSRKTWPEIKLSSNRVIGISSWFLSELVPPSDTFLVSKEARHISNRFTISRDAGVTCASWRRAIRRKLERSSRVGSKLNRAPLSPNSATLILNS